MTSDSVLTARGVRVFYSTLGGFSRAVDGVDLDLYPGQTLGLVGESGCGKSTLARALLGLLPPAAGADGEIIVDGRNLLELSDQALRHLRGPEIGMIFQEPMTRLNPLMRISDHFRELLRTHEPRISRAVASRRALDTLGAMGIPPTRFDQYPHEFSGGMLQRIMIALALVLEPTILVADEPTTALDVLVEAQILQIFADLRRHFDTAVMLITHSLSIIAETCDDVAVMYAGRIVERGPAREVFVTPQHPYTRELLASTISLTTTALHSIPGAPPNLVDPPPGCRFHPRCPNAMQVCAERQPRELIIDGVRVSCWLYDEEESSRSEHRALDRDSLALSEEA